MHDDLKAKLERFLPIGVVVRLHEGKVQGLVEHSMSMGLEAGRVRAFWSGKAYSILGEHLLDGLKDAKGNANKAGDFTFDALSEDCPIQLDWESWLADMEAQPGDKYRKRNAKFTVKPHGTWQLRALQAEKELACVSSSLADYKRWYTEQAEINNKVRAALNPTEKETDDEDNA